MKRKTKIWIITIAALFILAAAFVIWGYGKMKGHTDKRADSIRQDVEKMLDSVDSEDKEEFKACFSENISSQMEVSDRFGEFAEFVGTGAEIENGKVNGFNYQTSNGRYDDEMWMKFNISSDEGDFFIRVQKRFHSDPYLDGVSYIEVGTEDSGIRVVIGAEETN